LALLPTLAAAADKPETIAAGVTADFAAGKLVAVASCAADLYPPSADVARLKAERVARSRAEDKLRKALTVVVREHKAKLVRFGGAERVAKLPPLQPPVTISDGDATRGKAMFATCTACHGEKAAGMQDKGAPDLHRTGDWYLLAQLKKFKSGVRGSAPTDATGQQMRPMAATLPNEQAMKDVIAYIRTLQP